MRLIDADRLKEVFERNTGYDYHDLIDIAPTVERPHGEWEKYGDKKEAFDIEGNKSWGQMRRCTNCGFIKTYIEDFGFYSICPNCGADMREAGDELSRIKYFVCCPMCDKEKCVRGTEECDAEKWEKEREGEKE